VCTLAAGAASQPPAGSNAAALFLVALPFKPEAITLTQLGFATSSAANPLRARWHEIDRFYVRWGVSGRTVRFDRRQDVDRASQESRWRSRRGDASGMLRVAYGGMGTDQLAEYLEQWRVFATSPR
jgi:hypothetical protein